MTGIDFLSDKYVMMLLGGAAGIFATWIATRVLNKRAIFSYFVTHNKVGVSSESPMFDNINVTWHDRPIPDLFFSTIELKNESLQDFENIRITTYTGDTMLLSESTRIVDTPFILNWSEDYKEKLRVPLGESLTDYQSGLYGREREYVIPVFNRGQVVQISYLNSLHAGATQPGIWVSGNIKGVTIKFRVPHQEFIGVPVPYASLAGIVSGLVGLLPLVAFVSNPWLVAGSALAYGFVAQVPGAFLVKAFRFVRDSIGN